VVAPPHIPSFEVSLTRESLYNALVEMNIMYDVLLLHRLTPEALAPYKAIIIPDISWVEAKQLAALQAYKKSGGKIYTIGSAPELRDLATGLSPAELFAGLGDSQAREELRLRMASLEGEPLITLTGAPYVAANVVRKNGTDRFILHFVNYDKRLQHVRVRLNLEGMPVRINGKKVQCWSPDITEPKVSQIAVKGRTLEFTLPVLDVYDVVTVN
jgi:hypothetical protein